MAQDRGGRRVWQAHRARWIGAVDLPRAVRLQIDVDPYSFL